MIPLGRDVVFNTVPWRRSGRIPNSSWRVGAKRSGSCCHWRSRGSEMGKTGQSLVSRNGVSSRCSNDGRHGAGTGCGGDDDGDNGQLTGSCRVRRGSQRVDSKAHTIDGRDAAIGSQPFLSRRSLSDRRLGYEYWHNCVAEVSSSWESEALR